ncbi:MAG: DMT family transporter [Cyanobacteria bacterium P01_A01_bin.45]
MRYQQSITNGAMFIIAAEFTLFLNGVIIKLVSDGLPNEMIVFSRNLFGLLILMPFLIRESVNAGENIFQTSKFHLHLVRGIAGTIAMYCLFYAMANIQLADTMLIKSMVPILIPMIALIWLKERIFPLARLAIFVGFLGVFLVLKPGVEFNWVMLVALTSSVFAALSMVTIRKLSSTEPAIRTVSFFSAISLCITAIPLIWSWQNPTMEEWLLLAGIGLCSTAFQLLTTRGYASAPASEVGIFSFSSVIFGAVGDWLLWNKVWDGISFIGAICIAIACFLSLRSKRLMEVKKISD